MVTGEEFEESVFSCRAKLYFLDVTKEDGWKERGIGTLHVNKSTSEDASHKSRIVMRSDGVLRVILNLPLLKSYQIHSGMKSSLSSEKFVRISATEEGKPCQYAFKVSCFFWEKHSIEIIQQLTRVFSFLVDVKQRTGHHAA